ncbi:MAG: cytochrome c oxidase subunit II [Kofleriaceae bacterium]
MNELLHHLLNLPPQASSVSRGIDALHYVVILTTFFGVALVAAITLGFVVKYRRRSPAPALSPRVTSPLWLELGVGGALLALFCGWWVIGFAQYRELETPPANAIPIYVTAKQWMWKFEYPGGPASSEVLVVPVGTPVKLIMTSRDVIHGFYVPAFRIKQDVVPGHATTAWFEAIEAGMYPVMCTQYCGTRHSFMHAQVVALPPADFARWLEAARGPLALPGAKGEGQGLAERGRTVAAEHGCLRCHSVDGTRFIGPSWANAFGRRRALTGGGDVLIDEAYLTESMMDPNAKLAAGFAAVMPSYQGLLGPGDIAALLEYIRSLREVAPVAPTPAPTAPITYSPEGPRDAGT